MKIKKVGQVLYIRIRNLADTEEIKTDFVRKGVAGKNEKKRKQVKSTLRKKKSQLLERELGK
ncbi:MAG: hypothetical protein AAF770_03485 [Bacteroidota bacterium]